MIKLNEKKQNTNVFCQKLSKYYIATSSNLWMFQSAHDIFTLVINFKGLIGSQSMLLLVCSNQQKLLVKF
jgi:hypothetical protein